MKRIISILAVTLIPWLVSATSNISLRHLTNADGLSNSSVNTIYQDSRNIVWLGTWDGLNRYNGRTVKVYNQIPGDPTSLGNNVIRDIVEQGSGHIWVATDRGIDMLDEETGKFRRFFTETGRSIATEHAFHLCKDTARNTILAFIDDDGLYRYDPKSGAFSRLIEIGNLFCSQLLFDAFSHCWIIGTDGSVSMVSEDFPGRVELRRTPISDSTGVLSAFLDQDGASMWVQDNDGNFNHYDLDDMNLIKSYTYPSKAGVFTCAIISDSNISLGGNHGCWQFDISKNSFKEIVPDVRILSMMMGSQQILWLGTDMQGAIMLSNDGSSFNCFKGDNQVSFGNNAVRCFADEGNGNIWVGTKGAGLYRFKRHDDSQVLIAHFKTSNGLLDNSIYCLKQVGDIIWAGGDGDGLNYYDLNTDELLSLEGTDALNLCSIYAILPTSRDTIWVGTSGRGVFRLVIDSTTKPYRLRSSLQYKVQQDNNGISNNVVYSLLHDDSGHIWIGTRGGGLNRISDDGNISEIRLSNAKMNSDMADDVICLCKDSRGMIWAGTNVGLFLIDHENLTVTTWISDKDGLPNNTIHSILEDDNGDIWCSTNNGLAKIHMSEGRRVTQYNIGDGIHNNEFSDGSAFCSPFSGTFYFGGINGYTWFNPSAVRDDRSFPNLVLEEFRMDNVIEPLNAHISGKRNELVLSHNTRSVAFHFCPVDFLSSWKCETAFMLSGIDKDWIELGNSSIVALSNIKPGRHTLMVKCSNSDSIWSDEIVRIPMRVKPAWYVSFWAISLYVLIVAVCVFLGLRFIRYQMKVRQRIHDEETEKARREDIHEAKLRFFTNIAHEFSNSLTLIYGPCEDLLEDSKIPADEKKSLRIISSNASRMQQLIQQIISFRKADTGHLEIKPEIVDIHKLANSEVEYYSNAFKKKRIRFTVDIRDTDFFWPTDRDCLEKIAFNFLSNAMKYTPEGEEIKLIVREEGESLLLAVTNTGVGIEKNKQKSVFDRFEVISKFEKDIVKGKVSNGIGLAMCKSLAEILNGEIGIDSDEKTYTTFFVRLPKMDVVEKEINEIKESILPEHTTIEEDLRSNEEPVTPDVPKIKGPRKTKKVLVVDDDFEVRGFIRELLKEEYSVEEAGNGIEALSLISEDRPSLIITDLMMPQMDGVGLLHSLRENEYTRHLPVIMLSASSSLESRLSGLEKGADAYLSKPFHPRILLATVKNLIEREDDIRSYSKSAHAAMEQYRNRIVKREDKDLMIRLTDLIIGNISNESLSIEMLAGELGMSKMQLYRKVKETVGMAPVEYIKKLKMEHASYMLKTTSSTIQEIMFACGFSSKTYFYREFSKFYGCTPKQYRTQK